MEGNAKGFVGSARLLSHSVAKNTLTLNQRVQGSSPCAPTIELVEITGFFDLRYVSSSRYSGWFAGRFADFVPFSSFCTALTAIAGSRLK
jgi:hypothetical protein